MHRDTVLATEGLEGIPPRSLPDECMAPILGQTAISGFVPDKLGDTDAPAQTELVTQFKSHCI